MSKNDRGKSGVVYLSRSKYMSAEEEKYYSLLQNNYGLSLKLVTILQAIREIFYEDIPDDVITLDLLYAACVHLINDPNAKVYVEFGNHPTGQRMIPVMSYPGPVMGAAYMQPAPNKSPDSPEEIEPSVSRTCPKSSNSFSAVPGQKIPFASYQIPVG